MLFRWLSRKGIKHVVTYNNSFKKKYSKVEVTLNKNGIHVISAKEMLHEINRYVNETKKYKSPRTNAKNHSTVGFEW